MLYGSREHLLGSGTHDPIHRSRIRTATRTWSSDIPAIFLRARHRRAGGHVQKGVEKPEGRRKGLVPPQGQRAVKSGGGTRLRRKRIGNRCELVTLLVQQITGGRI